MIVTISGNVGSGKSTIAKIIEKELNFKRFYAGGYRREIAKDMGITIQELNKLDEKEEVSDNLVDKKIEELGKSKENLIVEGRTAYHFIPKSFKIFIDVSDEEGAKRIFKETHNNSNRNEKVVKTIQEQIKINKERTKSDIERYKKKYTIDIFDKSNFDFVLDTTNLSIEECVKIVKEKILENCNK